MCTFFVLFSPVTGQFVKVGHVVSYTPSLNYAKHFTSRWAAEHYAKKLDKPELFKVKPITRF